MINELAISDFRSIQSGTMEFGDINLLIGRNNTGKSSVLYALDLLVNNFGQDFSISNAEANLGKLRENVFRRKTEGEIQMSIKYSLEEHENQSLQDLFSNSTLSIPDLDFPEFIISTQIPIERNLDVDPNESLSIRSELSSNGVIIASRGSGGEELVFPDFDLDSPPTSLRYFPALPEQGDVRNVEPFDKVKSILRNLRTRRFFYIRPSRLQSTRTKQIVDNPVHYDVGAEGEFVTDIMAYNRDYVDLQEHKKRCLKWIKKFGFTDTVPRLVQAGSFSLELVDNDTGVQSNVWDIGSGTNQLLSLITQSFFAPEKSVLMIEEPEIHLHPEFQAKLADFFIAAQEFNDHQFFMETHSHHLLLRIQRRIAEGKIDPENVGIFFFDKSENGTEILQIVPNERGDLEHRIPNFFERDFKDVMGRFQAARKDSDAKDE